MRAPDYCTFFRPSYCSLLFRIFGGHFDVLQQSFWIYWLFCRRLLRLSFRGLTSKTWMKSFGFRNPLQVQQVVIVPKRNTLKFLSFHVIASRALIWSFAGSKIFLRFSLLSSHSSMWVKKVVSFELGSSTFATSRTKLKLYPP